MLKYQYSACKIIIFFIFLQFTYFSLHYILKRHGFVLNSWFTLNNTQKKKRPSRMSSSREPSRFGLAAEYWGFLSYDTVAGPSYFHEYLTVQTIIHIAFVIQLTSAIIRWVLIIAHRAVCQRDVSWWSCSHRLSSFPKVFYLTASETRRNYTVYFIQEGWLFCP